jgi:hypothetical protein
MEMSRQYIRIVCFLLVSLAAAVPLSACSSEEVAPGAPCEDVASECSEGLKCICIDGCTRNFCSKFCSGDVDCPSTFIDPICKGFGTTFICVERDSPIAKE